MRAARFITIALLAFATSGCGWLQFGYNAGHTSFNDSEKELTAARLSELDYDWFNNEATDSPGAPVFSAGRLFVPHGNSVTAFDTGSGAVLWEKAVFYHLNVEFDTLTVADGEVLAPYAFNDGFFPATGVAAFEVEDGTLHDPDLTGVVTDLSAITVRGDIRAQGGRGETGYSGPAAMVQYGPVMTPKLGLVEVGSGSGEAPTTPTFLGNRIFTSLGNQVYAFRLDTCVPAPELPLEEFCAPEWVSDLGTSAGSFWTRTIVAVGTDAIAVPAADKTVRVLDAATGAARWRTAAVTGKIGGVAVAQGSLYVGAESGLAVYSAGGCIGGVCSPTWTSTDPGQVLTAPVVAADVLYASGTDGAVHAFPASGCGSASCSDIWTASTGGDLIYTIVWNSRIYLVDRDTGDIAALQRFPSP